MDRKQHVYRRFLIRDVGNFSFACIGVNVKTKALGIFSNEANPY